MGEEGWKCYISSSSAQRSRGETHFREGGIGVFMTLSPGNAFQIREQPTNIRPVLWMRDRIFPTTCSRLSRRAEREDQQPHHRLDENQDLYHRVQTWKELASMPGTVHRVSYCYRNTEEITNLLQGSLESLVTAPKKGDKVRCSRTPMFLRAKPEIKQFQDLEGIAAFVVTQ